ncbi:hypothetical protein CARUB_v10005541mg [Capsella rubella]|uniref:C2 domain-containing protein n=1 Tax=Capsella rubella TaxID=81985 RepID=R0F624_9BRAS|nr:classical arabinogalactan protein 9 [Capsella rubella]EOA17267.1 hypothetical protein CARUB_v10005541mg [Capsella rubella]
MSMMSGIQGQVLEVTVVGCQKLKDTEWFSRQDPYVVLEYSGARHRTRTCTDGGKNAVFQEKFMFTLLEGLRDLKVAVWNSNTLSTDDFIGNATIQLQKVLSQGYDDCTWTLQTKTGRFAGEVRLILHYAGAKKHNYAAAPSAPYAPQVPQYSAPPSASPYSSAPPSASPYSSAPYTGPSLYPQVQQYPQPSGYPPASAYPPQPSAYPPPPSTSAYPPVPSAYPPPPPSSTYPPPPYPPQPSYYSQGPYPGQYPPPPY